MRFKKLPVWLRITLALGLLLATLPMLLHDYIKMPDFLGGILGGFGLGLEIVALVKIRRLRGADINC